MRICFVVADVRDQQPTYAGVYLALAAHRRGHDVRFVSVDDLSFLDDNNILATTTRVRAGDYATTTEYAHALASGAAHAHAGHRGGVAPAPRGAHFGLAPDGPIVAGPRGHLADAGGPPGDCPPRPRLRGRGALGHVAAGDRRSLRVHAGGTIPGLAELSAKMSASDYQPFILSRTSDVESEAASR